MSNATVSSPNKVIGTWRMVSAQIDGPSGTTPAYGEHPDGLLIFAPDLRYVEVLVNRDVPRFESSVRGQGTDAENRQAMANIGMFGIYSVDANGDFSGNRVEGATFPNVVGNVRTRNDLRIDVEGDVMMNYFTRPDGTKIVIRFERAR